MNTPGSCRITRSVGAAAAAAWALPIAFIEPPSAAADPCPDVEVVFARGTTEPPGVGGVGQAFVDSLRSPAGARDASTHIQRMASNCPNIRMVLGGYSQGAGVIDISTTEMPPQVADHVAATVLFGAPRSAFADTLSPGPLPAIGPLYAAKTIDLCVPNDPICSNGWDMRAHGAYVETGMVNQAATFAASRL
jgi:cutinase-like protein